MAKKKKVHLKSSTNFEGSLPTNPSEKNLLRILSSERVTVWRAEDIHPLLAKIERGEA